MSRHVDGIRGTFYVSNDTYLVTTTIHEKGMTASEVIRSNTKQIVQQQQYFFETLWNKSILGEYKVREIETGIPPDDIIELIIQLKR